MMRVDAPAKTTGKALYTHDVRLPGMLHARLINSPHAHATLTKLDFTEAMKIPGAETGAAGGAGRCGRLF